MTIDVDTWRRRLGRLGIWSGLHQLAALDDAAARTVVTEADRLGYGALWIGENLAREAMSHAAILLSRSERLVVATGIANMWARDPAAMANGARTLALAHPGRVVLGVGVSHRPIVAERGGTAVSGGPLSSAVDYLERMASTSWLGPHVDDPAPVLLGSQGPRMLEVAGRLAHGAHPYLVTPEWTRRARSILGPAALLAPEQGVVLTSDPAEARRLARRHLEHYLALPNYRRSFLRQDFVQADLEDGGSDVLVDGLIAWGTPEQVADRARDHVEAGADHVALQFLTSSVDGLLEAMEAMANLLDLSPSTGVVQ